jgi:predicted glycogen debranching enzyme
MTSDQSPVAPQPHPPPARKPRNPQSDGGAPLLELGPAVIQRPERSAVIEWLETNGLGDSASGTVAGPNTRRQHGLFIAGAEPAARPMLLLAALDVALDIESGELARPPSGGPSRPSSLFELSCHQYVGARHPQGFRHCVRFRADPFPEWRFELPAAALTRRLFMPHGKRCVVNCWTLDAASPSARCRLKVRPLCAFRDADALTRSNDRADLALRPARPPSGGGDGGAVSIGPYPGCPRMFLQFGRAEVKPEAVWYYRFQHPWDIALGLEGVEDLFSPCELTFDLAPGRTAWLAAGIEAIGDPAEILEARERQRRASLRIPDLENDPAARILARAADAFVAADAGRTRIVAAYPEPHADPPQARRANLRMALIALPGILLCTRRLIQAKDFLDGALAELLAPGEDAAGDEWLWFIRAAELYLDHSRDWDFLRGRLQPGCESLVRRTIEKASENGYRLAADGLLISSDPGRALTWMDATLGDWPVTPRAGKPVEVNALWHHALGLLTRWAARRNEPQRAQQFAALRELAGRSFRDRFWNAAEQCLYDVIDLPSGAVDPAIRPNQIFALSLSSDLLERRQAAGVLAAFEKRLLAPPGPRTLSLEDKAFQPKYAGSALERAAARHQGAIFPWLLGAYVDAVFRVHGRTPRAGARAAVCLQPLLAEYLREGCLGQISELFQGIAPHTPQGAFAHAAAVGEILRAHIEVGGVRVKDEG